jgi:Tol biopolymer transport system component
MAGSSRYPQTMVLKFTGALTVALLVAAALATQAGALPATYDGIAADGHLALFNTAEQMVPGDTDHEQDVYVRAKDATLGEWVTREVSIGPLGGNDAYPAQYDGVSSDGTEVFFSTKEPLVPADTDRREDVYMRNLNTNTTTLVSQGDPSCMAEGCGNGAADSSFVPGGVVLSGERVFFATTERLSAADKDSSLDVYMRNLANGKTVLVSGGASSCAGSSCGNGPQPAFFEQASADGEKVFFTSTEGLVVGDEDGRVDIYERDLGTEATKLVSVPGTCPPSLPAGQNCDPTFGGASSDGSHVFFESNERISGADEDNSQDVYDWSGSGTPSLASTGPSGGNGAFNATYSGTAGSTGAVYFETSEALDPATDKDTEQDVYVRSEGTTELVSTGPESNGPAPASFQWASPDGSVAIFSTSEALTPQDTDTAPDVYERSGGVTTLVSTGPEGGNGSINAAFAKASSDGSHVFFVTAESLVEEDEDESADVYLRAGGETTLVSTGPLGGNGAFSAGLHGVSADGSQAFFTTQERLTVDDDFASEEDVYSWTAGKSGPTTLLVSVKNASELVLGPPPPFLEGTNPASPAETTEPSLFGQAEAGATITIYTSSSCSGESVPPGGSAEELAGEGIPVTVAAGTKKTFYATAELEGVVSPCSNGVSYKQEAAPSKEEESGGGGSPGGGTGGGGGGGSGSELDRLPSSNGAAGGQSFVTPETTITFGPASKTRKHRVVFRFDDATGQPGTNFVCKLDHHHWQGCRSPRWLKKLSFGRHVFAVKAVNKVGTWDQGPAKRAFKVVR